LDVISRHLLDEYEKQLPASRKHKSSRPSTVSSEEVVDVTAVTPPRKTMRVTVTTPGYSFFLLNIFSN
jgi:hypothetical protein